MNSKQAMGMMFVLLWALFLFGVGAYGIHYAAVSDATGKIYPLSQEEEDEVQP